MDSMLLTPFEPGLGGTISSWARTVDEVQAWCSLSELPVPEHTIDEWAAAPDTEAYVLRDADLVVGYGELWIDHDLAEVELGHLIVDPSQRNRGVGRALTAGLIRAARAHHHQVFLRVVPENTAARRCYASAGMARVDTASEAAWNEGQPRTYVWMAAT